MSRSFTINTRSGKKTLQKLSYYTCTVFRGWRWLSIVTRVLQAHCAALRLAHVDCGHALHVPGPAPRHASPYPRVRELSGGAAPLITVIRARVEEKPSQWRREKGLAKLKTKSNRIHPIDPFTILELNDSSHEVLELHKICRSPDLEALEL